jgi:hypothetical protein
VKPLIILPCLRGASPDLGSPPQFPFLATGPFPPTSPTPNTPPNPFTLGATRADLPIGACDMPHVIWPRWSQQRTTGLRLQLNTANRSRDGGPVQQTALTCSRSSGCSRHSPVPTEKSPEVAGRGSLRLLSMIFPDEYSRDRQQCTGGIRYPRHCRMAMPMRLLVSPSTLTIAVRRLNTFAQTPKPGRNRRLLDRVANFDMMGQLGLVRRSPECDIGKLQNSQIDHRTRWKGDCRRLRESGNESSIVADLPCRMSWTGGAVNPSAVGQSVGVNGPVAWQYSGTV